VKGRARTHISRASGELVDAIRRTAQGWRAPSAAPEAAADPVAAWPEYFQRNAPYAPTPEARPAPLDCGALPLTRDARSQMAFGERAAFEGVLAQVRPGLAIEIGTAEGGTLRRMAAYSGLVYSIDVDQRPVGDDVPANVRLLTGDSATLLPELLRSLQETGKPVNLALVDGDHSYEGVRRDVSHLLDSPCTARSVILVHDTMNAEVRAGVESVSVEDHPGVVYYELDFVPGYVFRRGAARDMAWGGLGLILTDREHAPADGRSPRQDLYHEPFDAIQALRAARA
jgi:Methyltransferase domain